MLGIVFDFAFQFAVALVTGAVDKLGNVATAPQPDLRRVRAAEGAYRAWAGRRGFVRDDGVRGFRGKLGRHEAVVRPGLDGSAPAGVEVEIEIDFDRGDTGHVLLTLSSRGEGPVAKALSKSFDDADLAGTLRSIGVTSTGLRLRFAALTPPDVVEHGATRAVDAIVELAMNRSAPYR